MASQMACSFISPLSPFEHGYISPSQEMDVGDMLVRDPDEGAEELMGWRKSPQLSD